jgi:putative colanic acid biosynthesis acetyltransferase WcaF
MILKKTHINSSTFGFKNKLSRILWRGIYFFMFRYSPVPLFKYRSIVLKLCGADVQLQSRIYPSANIWLPSNLKMGSNATLGPCCNIYNQGLITIESDVIISQGAYLCASTHDYNNPIHPLLLKPITIKRHSWICADAFIGPGVTVGEGGVIGARGVLSKDTEPWSVYAGNPAVKIKNRRRFDNE